MALEKIKVQSFGKWILAGEHAVIRGGACLVLPLKSVSLEMTYKENNQPLSITFSGVFNDLKLNKFCEKVIRKTLVQIKNKNLKGALEVHSTIPLGYGLGGSAAFCVSLLKLFSKLGLIKENQVLESAIQLENEFHGKSSGVDVLSVYHNKPLLVQKKKSLQIQQNTSLDPFTYTLRQNPVTYIEDTIEVEFVDFQFQSSFYLLNTKRKSETKHCVKKVQQAYKKNPKRGKALDEKMSQATMLCFKSLTSSSKDYLLELAQAIQQAYDCFVEWDLCSKEDLEEIEYLKSKGALAVKPTGSGGGGFLLSLWKTPCKLNKEGFWVC